MLKELIAICNELDSKGLTKEADVLEQIIYKIAGEWRVAGKKQMMGGTFDIWEKINADGSKRTVYLPQGKGPPQDDAVTNSNAESKKEVAPATDEQNQNSGAYQRLIDALS